MSYIQSFSLDNGNNMTIKHTHSYTDKTILLFMKWQWTYGPTLLPWIIHLHTNPTSVISGRGHKLPASLKISQIGQVLNKV